MILDDESAFFYIQFGRQAAAHYGLSAAAANVVKSLAMHADETGQCWPSIKRLMGECSLGRSAVNAAISELKKVGIVSSEQGVGGRRSATFTLHTDVDPEGRMTGKQLARRDRKPSKSGVPHSEQSGVPHSEQSGVPHSEQSGVPHRSGVPHSEQSGVPHSEQSGVPHTEEPVGKSQSEVLSLSQERGIGGQQLGPFGETLSEPSRAREPAREAGSVVLDLSRLKIDGDIVEGAGDFLVGGEVQRHPGPKFTDALKKYGRKHLGLKRNAKHVPEAVADIRGRPSYQNTHEVPVSEILLLVSQSVAFEAERSRQVRERGVVAS